MTAASARTATVAVQRRTVRTLFLSQVLGGVGVASGIAVGSLLAEDVGGSASLAGLAQTATVLGSALVAVPMSRLMAARGRRPGLVAGYLLGGLGALVAITGAAVGSYPVLLLGLACFGGASASNLQARYAATDLAEPARRGRSLALVVWATTLGTVLGPNLTEPGGALAAAVGLPRLAGPYLFAVVAFALSVAVLAVRLRPDPLLLSRGAISATGRQLTGPSSPAAPRTRLAASLRTIGDSPPARLGLVAVAVAHTVMVSVMVMTPVHMHHGGATLRVIGFVISGHVAGMYAFSPVLGWLADRLGRVAVIGLGLGVLALSLALAGTAPGGHSARLGVALFLLGLGWSACLVAGSTLLSESVPAETRPGVQGAADLVMGLCGAAGGALAGVVVGVWGFPVLTVAAAPLLVLVLVAGGTPAARRATPEARRE